MQSAEYWIEKLDLFNHPEGGFFRETYRSKTSYEFRKSPVFSGNRAYSTAIYYLLTKNDRSKLHRIKSDELWFYHTGAPLTVYLFHDVGFMSTLTLDPGTGTFQGIVPANTWFGARHETESPEAYTLTSCVVSPGFDFSDFTLADRDSLTRKFPQHAGLIEDLT
ncbi:cupin domain-containing protein [Prosthecochloris sp.]|uniref:cupin domain-containing protein n=1 Tax=Prosthecochloris sp. TaxID=290513 RepID=UPI0025805772|nr:cupin domain-containing protein [Prosthecochloris sp.]